MDSASSTSFSLTISTRKKIQKIKKKTKLIQLETVLSHLKEHNHNLKIRRAADSNENFKLGLRGNECFESLRAGLVRKVTIRIEKACSQHVDSLKITFHQAELFLKKRGKKAGFVLFCSCSRFLLFFSLPLNCGTILKTYLFRYAHSLTNKQRQARAREEKQVEIDFHATAHSSL